MGVLLSLEHITSVRYASNVSKKYLAKVMSSS